MGMVLFGFFLVSCSLSRCSMVVLNICTALSLRLLPGLGLGIVSLTIEALRHLQPRRLPSLSPRTCNSDLETLCQHSFAFTRFLNHHFAAQVDRLLAACISLRLIPHAPITNAFAMELLIFFVLLLYFIAVRATLSVEKPGAVQHLAEMTHEFVTEQSEIHHRARIRAIHQLHHRAVPVHPAVQPAGPGSWLRIAHGQPGGAARAVAIVTFVYYHYHGIRANGFSYVKQFLGPVWWLYPLMLPIEVISHFARCCRSPSVSTPTCSPETWSRLPSSRSSRSACRCSFSALHFGVAITRRTSS